MKNISSMYSRFTALNRTYDEAKKIHDQRILDAIEVYDLFSSKFIARDCPICSFDQKESVNPFIKRYNIARCKRCMSLFVDPCPTMAAISYYYNECKSPLLVGDLLRKRGEGNNAIIDHRLPHVISLITQILEYTEYVNILEVGCSSGSFLSKLTKALDNSKILSRVNIVGIDIDADAIKRSVDRGLELKVSSIEEFALNNSSSYDLILHFELIEHLINPLGFMRNVNQLLAPGGYCYFHTPNSSGMDNIALGYNNFRPIAHGIFPPMHLQGFNSQNLLHFVISSGFNLISHDTQGIFDVDIVKTFGNLDDLGSFANINSFSDNQLAIVQSWLQELKASSHMSCTIQKQD